MSVLKLNANTFLYSAHAFGCFLATGCKSREPERRRSALRLNAVFLGTARRTGRAVVFASGLASSHSHSNPWRSQQFPKLP